ncbi:hypothetical protein CY35_03G077800 [Sphagnum magellanicum]|nr:hypothetical protein CY35_03G077800 [Sphagnum magellanicum]
MTMLVTPQNGSSFKPSTTGQGRTQSKNWSKTLELEDFSNAQSKVPEEYLLKEAFVQNDTVTSTSSTVKFREETNTTMVTLTATVRGNPSAKGDEKANQKSVILAAHALSQMCISLEEKAKVVLAMSVKKPSVEVASGCSGRDPLSEVGPCSAARKHSLEVTLGTLSRDSQIEHEHARILEQLRTGEVAEAFEIKKGYGATSFRPVYVVKLSQTDGLLSPALFKPFNPGDASRYKRASVEWIAYKLGQLLETDMVPPAVMRTKLQIGGRMFALGTMLHYVPDIRTLTHEGPKEWGAESPLHFVSNANILDALVGNAPRDCRLFAEGLHWVHWGQRRPMLLDHPRSAPDNSKPRSIWTPGVINFKGLRKVSARTLAALKCLDFSILHENLGSHLSVKELDEILHRRDHVVMCCESTQRTSASSEA